MSFKTFLNYTVETCVKYGVSLALPHKKTHNKSIGMFYLDNRSKPTLVCCTNNNSWPSYFVHEVAHMHQWIDDPDEWLSGGDNLWDYLPKKGKGKHYKEDRLNVFKSHLECEVDCALRSLDFINGYQIKEIHPDKFTKDSNIYNAFYRWVYETGEWDYPRLKKRYGVKHKMSSELFDKVLPTEQVWKRGMEIFLGDEFKE